MFPITFNAFFLILVTFIVTKTTVGNIPVHQTNKNNCQVRKYVKIINEGIENSLKYKQKQNAFEYQTNKSNQTDCYDCEPTVYGEFDFIIIGSGASGSVIANRLTEVRHFDVLLLDAGHFEDDFIKIPGVMSYSGGTEFNWSLKSVPQKHGCLAMVENKCQLFRGRGIGGSTIVSPLIYTRPLPSDFDQWNATSPGWSYLDVLPYFNKAERFTNTITSKLIKNKHNQQLKPLNIEIPDYTTPHIDAFLSANQELGFSLVNINNISQKHQELLKHNQSYTTTKGIVSRIQINTQNGRRLSIGDAYITPIRNRSNLNISTDSYVTQILFDNKNNKKQAVGVIFCKNQRKYIATVRKEIILSSGAISSPQILIQSGIGPKTTLNNLGVKSVVDLQGVGKNYQTHVAIFGLSIQTNTSINSLTLEDNVRLYLQGTGVLTMGGNRGAIGYYKIPNLKSKKNSKLNAQGQDYDLEFIFLTPNRTAGFYQSGFAFKPIEYQALTHNLKNEFTFSVFISPRYTKSVGEVTVGSKNNFEFPIVNPNLLSDNYDVEALYQGVLLLQKMLKTKAMRRLNARLVYIKLPKCNKFGRFTKHYWYCFIRQTTDELFHPIGTCKMTSGSRVRNGVDGVVDEEFNVFGVNGLRVADASVIPFSMTGHTASSCVMIGERCADIIKKHFN